MTSQQMTIDQAIAEAVKEQAIAQVAEGASEATKRELCAAVLHLIKHPNASIEKLVEFVPGPDFPTGGVLVEPRAQILEAYRTGRGGFRLRANWKKEDTGRGGYTIRARRTA